MCGPGPPTRQGNKESQLLYLPIIGKDKGIEIKLNLYLSVFYSNINCLNVCGISYSKITWKLRKWINYCHNKISIPISWILILACPTGQICNLSQIIQTNTNLSIFLRSGKSKPENAGPPSSQIVVPFWTKCPICLQKIFAWPLTELSLSCNIHSAIHWLLVLRLCISYLEFLVLFLSCPKFG